MAENALCNESYTVYHAFLFMLQYSDLAESSQERYGGNVFLRDFKENVSTKNRA